MKNLPFSPDILPDNSALAIPWCVTSSDQKMTGTWSSVTRREGGGCEGGRDMMRDITIYMTSREQPIVMIGQFQSRQT